MFFRKLLSKILFAVFLGSVIVFSAVSFFSFLFIKTSLQQSIMSAQFEMTRQSMDKIDRLLNERCAEIQFIAGVKLFEVFLTKPPGEDLTRPQKNASKRMAEIVSLTGPWDLLLVTDQEGKVVLSSEEGEAGKTVQQDSLTRKAFEGAIQQELYYSDLETVSDTGRPAVIFSAPVRNTNVPGRPVIGTVIGYHAWPSVLQVLEDIPEGAALFNHEGMLIGQNSEFAKANPFSERMTNPEMEQRLKAGRSASMIHFRTRNISDETMLQKSSRSLDDSGRQTVLASLGIQSGYLSYRGSSWGLVLEQPSSIAFAPAKKSALRLVLFLLPIVVLTSIPVLLMILRWVVRPITLLTQTTREITAGDLTKQVFIKGEDEIGQLAEAFNLMTTKLKESHEYLEQQVLERTEEILKTNEALKGSERKIQLVIETAKDAFIALDSGGRVTTWNRQAEETFGWTRQESIGQFLADLIIPHQYREAHTKGLQRYLQTGEGPVLNKQIEIAALHRKGHEFPVELTIWPVRTGTEISFNAFIRDISERKRLEQVVLQSEKMSAVGHLAAGVAHEINNPLGVILGFAQGVVKRIQPGDPFEMPLKSIEREAVRCKNLVQDLLVFSRTRKAAKEEIDVSQAIETALSLVAAQSKVKNVELEKEFGNDLPRISANQNELQQVVVNLCNNAMDAMPKGGKVTVSIRKKSFQGKEGVEIAVEDNGTGIPPEIKSRIFDPFFTTKEIGKGTGLGLSLVYETVERHGGKIEVQSEVAKGTVFHVWLPV